MSKKKPNIVMLVNDHEAYYRHGWDGGARPQRPHLNRLAREGVRFENAYSVCPLCTPARRSMMTGLFPHNHGFLTLDPKQNGPEHDEGILFDLLHEAGYDCYMYGKWHAGPGTAKDYGCEGFSYPGFGNPYITPEYKDYCKRKGIKEASFNLEHVFLEPVSPDIPDPGPGYQCKAPNFHPHVTGVMETESEGHESFFLADLACDKLDELAETRKEEPFFLRVDFFGPHAPYLASREYLDMYPPESIQEYGSYRNELGDKPPVYMKEWNTPFGKDKRLQVPSPVPWDEWQRILRYVYAQITQVDAAGGRILDALERCGFSENTLVIWTTDHGDPIAAHGGHFGKESFLDQESLRIPMVMRWPERISGRQNSNHLVSNLDVPSTLLSAAETGFNGPVDSESLLQLFNTQGKLDPNVEWRDDLMIETHGHHWEKIAGRSIVSDRYHYAFYNLFERPEYIREGDDLDNMSELYDLENDPYQLHNLAREREYATIVEDMHRRLQRWRKKTGDTAW